jgi:hypothetical protein
MITTAISLHLTPTLILIYLFTRSFSHIRTSSLSNSYTLIYPLIRSLHQTISLSHSFTLAHTLTYTLLYSSFSRILIHSHSFTQSQLVPSFTLSRTFQIPSRSLAFLFAHSLIQFITNLHFLTDSLTHSHSHLPIHSFTSSLFHALSRTNSNPLILIYPPIYYLAHVLIYPLIPVLTLSLSFRSLSL